MFVLLRLWGKVLGGEGVPSGFWETNGIFGNASDFVLALPLPRRFLGAAGGGAEEKEEEEKGDIHSNPGGKG